MIRDDILKFITAYSRYPQVLRTVRPLRSSVGELRNDTEDHQSLFSSSSIVLPQS